MVYTLGMKRTQIQLDEASFETLRERAFHNRTSVAEEIRRLVRAGLVHAPGEKRPGNSREFRFSFVGKGKSRGPGAGTISERHDDEFADSIV